MISGHVKHIISNYLHYRLLAFHYFQWASQGFSKLANAPPGSTIVIQPSFILTAQDFLAYIKC